MFLILCSVIGGICINEIIPYRLPDYLFSLLGLVSVFFGIFFSFEYEKIRGLMRLENIVSNISPLLEIEILSNEKKLIRLYNEIGENEKNKKRIALNEDDFLDASYWELYKDVIKEWGAPNTLRLKEIYGLSYKLNDIFESCMAGYDKNYKNDAEKLIKIIDYHFDEVDKLFKKRRLPPIFPKRAINTLEIYEKLEIKKLNEIIKDRINYFEHIINSDSNYYGQICSNRKIAYVDIALPSPGVFWIPENKIYIQCSVKKTSLYHDFLIEHEKKHYNNYNSKKNILFKAYADIKMELWDDINWELLNKKLNEDKNNYLKEWQKEVLNREKEFYEKIESIHPPNLHQKIYSKIVQFFSKNPIGVFIFLIVHVGIILTIIRLGLARAINAIHVP